MYQAMLGKSIPSLLRRPKLRILIGFSAIFLLVFLVLPYRQKLSYRLAQHHGPPPHSTKNATSQIPPKIWQISLPKSGSSDPFVIDPGVLGDTASWLAMNPGAGYILVGSEWADRFVESHYARDEHLRRTYHALQNPGMKSDLLRYLVLLHEGGVYTDTDTVALKPVSQWVPEHLRSRVRLIVGIEYDRRDHKPWAEFPHDVQFCQWTIAAAPEHPVFADMARRAVASLEGLTAAYNTTLSRLKPADFEVLTSTGPAAWTGVVFDHIRLADPGVTHLTNLSYMTGPRLYGDILVLNIDGFGSGLPHSGATDGSSGLALAKHNFRGSWREVPW